MTRSESTPGFRRWEIVPAVFIALGGLGIATLAFLEPRALDVGLAYRGGAVAWETGRPENLKTWMSTSFLAMVMAFVSQVLSRDGAVLALNALNLGLVAAIAAAVWRPLRGRVSRAFWWISLTLAVFFSPLISTVLLRQFNLIAFALALGAFGLLRSGRAAGAGAVAALSVCVKPVVVLLPLAFLVRRDTRRSGVWCVVFIALFTAAAQVFLAVRAGDVTALSPLPALRSFEAKAAAWVCHPENFSPHGLLCRLLGGGVWGPGRAMVTAGVLLLIFLANDAVKDRAGAPWEVFAFACLLSPMVSPVAWSHYQLFLAPMFLLLGYRFWFEGAGGVRWVVLVFAYGLAELTLRPLDTLPGGLAYLASGLDETRPQLLRVMTLAQFAQYVLLLLALAWFSRKDLRADRGGRAAVR